MSFVVWVDDVIGLSVVWVVDGLSVVLCVVLCVAELCFVPIVVDSVLCVDWVVCTTEGVVLWAVEVLSDVFAVVLTVLCVVGVVSVVGVLCVADELSVVCVLCEVL